MRAIVTARTQHELRRMWLATVPSHPRDYGAPDDRGRWRYEPIDTGDPDRMSWEIHPADAPASQTDIFYDKPRTVHYDPTRTQLTKGQFRSSPTTRGTQFVDPSTTDHRNEHIDYVDTPPGMLWRGMSSEEYEESKKRGYLQSPGEYNMGDEQRGKTFFSTQPSSAGSYADSYTPYQFKPTFTRPAYVVGIPDRPDAPRGPLGDDPRSHEVGLEGQIPWSEVKHTYVGRPHAITPGRIDISRDLSWGEQQNPWQRPVVNHPGVDLRWEALQPEVKTAAEDLLTDPRRVDPDYFTGIHEMGHVLDLMGGSDNTGRNTRTRERLNDELIRYYIQQFPEKASGVYKPPVYDKDGNLFEEARYGLGGGMPEFRQWLRNQLPGGAFQGNQSIGDFANMNLAEGPAHAFTEVELNPQANDVSRLIHKVMLEESRPETSQVLRERMDNPYYRQQWEREYGDYPGHDPAPPPAKPNPEPKINHDSFEDVLPYGIEKAVNDVRTKYPQVNLRGVDVDEQNRGGTAFVTPEVSYGQGRGKQNKPQMSVERKWVDAAPSEWDKWMDKDADEGFFPRWQSTTASEPWPEDQIDDFVDERNDLAKMSAYDPTNRTDPAELSWRDLLWMNNVMRDTTNEEQRAYSDALDAELSRRSDPHLVAAARVTTSVFADPDGSGVWQRDAASGAVRFIPAPHRVSD